MTVWNFNDFEFLQDNNNTRPWRLISKEILYCTFPFNFFFIDLNVYAVKSFTRTFFIHIEKLLATKFRTMVCAHSLWAWRDHYRATPFVTRGRGFCYLIWRTTTYICYNKQGMLSTYSNPEPHWALYLNVMYILNITNSVL
jgi:hypothetical protein